MKRVEKRAARTPSAPSKHMKKTQNRAMRRAAKRDPEEAPKKAGNLGWGD